MGIALCESDYCKTAKLSVGSHLGPVLEILMDNLPLNFYILCIKEVSKGLLVSFQWCKILNIFFYVIHYIKLYRKMISFVRPRAFY